MRFYDRGSSFVVTVSRNEVQKFAQSWPCFGKRRELWFEFEKRNGDLVGLHGDRGMDGTAVSALADDAKAYGQKRMMEK
jgi:hypothetical protein